MIAVLDACVLYPPSLRDLLLTLAALDAFDPRWSNAILDEVTRNVTSDHPDIDPTRFESHTIVAMSRAFPEAAADPPMDLIVAMDNDPKDRHVAAAAVHGRADLIVTNNLGDFVSERLAIEGIEVITPGVLIDRLLDESPEVVVLAVRGRASRSTRAR